MLTRIHFVVTFVSYMLIVLATICMIADDTAYLCVCVCVCVCVCACVCVSGHTIMVNTHSLKSLSL